MGGVTDFLKICAYTGIVFAGLKSTDKLFSWNESRRIEHKEEREIEAMAREERRKMTAHFKSAGQAGSTTSM
ncbi:hypothetical protein WJX72_002067 [[Myrmecia] bisecta]|uniref:Uncharacterized protein n=1 Tax=[Myrmecia] bisecta TaxID=41462 RepID=A0AAW1Q6U3_9CHLO